MSKQVHQYHATGEYKRSFKSIAEAASLIGCDESTIRKIANGEGNTGYGYRWSYNKYASIWDRDSIDRYMTSKGIAPEEVVEAKIYQTVKGDDRISIKLKKIPEITEESLEKEHVQRKQKQLQRTLDEKRVINKHFREFGRVENTLTSLNEALNEQLTNQTFKPITYEHPETEGAILIVQITDTHFNELVEMPDNEYGFITGARRLQKFAHKIRKIAEVYKPRKIIVAFTGDMINSDRRLDEKMHMATNRTKAALITTQILFHFLQDINRVANLSVVSVSGNESRVSEEWGMSEFTMSDNYDFLIYNMLKLLFKDSKGIEFVDGDPVEQVINVNNCNVLITHGTTIKEGQAAMQQVFGKYAGKGILLDYAIFGHIHFTNITDIYSRSGSLVGNSIYSDRHLNLITKASQLVHVIEPDGSIDNIKVGLQYVADHYKGYDIKDDITAYNPKLASNVKQRTTIVKVII